MSLPVFVVGADALQRPTVELDGDEGHHAAVVKRARVGEHIMLTDMAGNGAECQVRSVSRRGLVAEVLSRRFAPPPAPRLVVVQAIPKGEHADRAVDLLTEVGVDEIVPWRAERCVVSWQGEREAKGLARWRATARAAAKQSRRLRFPQITDAMTTDEVSTVVAGADVAVVLDEAAVTPLDRLLDAVTVAAAATIVLVVGPEGGITDAELAGLTAAGAVSVRLGPTVLRSSSAGLAGAAVVLSRTGRWT